MSMNVPQWLLDLPGQSTQDPLLDQLEEERRRRRQTEDIAPPPTPIAAPTYVEPFSGYPQPGNPQSAPVSTVDQDRAEQDARDAEAKVQMLEARKADQEAAGVTSDGEMHPSRQDTDGGLKNPGTTATGVDAWGGMVQAASQAYGVPQNVIKAIMDIESGGDPSATSALGAQGLMQVMSMHNRNGDNLYDPATNIEYGTRLLAENFQRYGSWEKAAAAYFGAIDGDGNITNASDGNAGGYEYVDKFTTKAEAYASQQQGIAPTYGPSLPGARPIDVANLRPSQLPGANPDLTVDEAYAACGPAAAIVFAAMMGRSPNLKEAVEMAKTIKAWDQGVGMYGMDAEVRLIQALGGQAKVAAFDPQTVQSEITNGNPVIVDAPGHYGVISGYDPASDRYYFGTSATDLKGGEPWMTLDQYQSLNANQGAIRGMLLVDNPLGHGPSLATSQGGPSIPRTWSPSDSHKAALGEDVEGRVAQDEIDAAHRLAEQVGNQVRKSQEDARRQTEAQVQITSPAQPSSAQQPSFAPEEYPGNLDLLKPETPKPTTSSTDYDAQTDQALGLPPGTTAQGRQADLDGANDSPSRAFGRTFENNARAATLGLIKSLYDYAGSAANVVGLGDAKIPEIGPEGITSERTLTDQFNSRVAGFAQLLEDPRNTGTDVDIYDPSTYADPKTYAAITGQLLPSVLASMATGAAASLLLGKTAAAPLIAQLPQLGTRAAAAGSAAFTIPTAGGAAIPELKKLGASDLEAFVGGTISGTLQAALEMVNPIEHAGGSLSQKLFSETDASRPLMQRILGAARELVANVGKEGFEEGSQQFADNVVAKWFGSDKGWFDQVLENFVIGGIGAGAMGAPRSLASLVGKRPSAAQEAQAFQGRADELEQDLLRQGLVEQAPESFPNGTSRSETEQPASSGDENSGQQKTSSTVTEGRSSFESGPGFAGNSGPVLPGVSGALRERRSLSEDPGEAGSDDGGAGGNAPLPGPLSPSSSDEYRTRPDQAGARGFQSESPTSSVSPADAGLIALVTEETRASFDEVNAGRADGDVMVQSLDDAYDGLDLPVLQHLTTSPDAIVRVFATHALDRRGSQDNAPASLSAPGVDSGSNVTMLGSVVPEATSERSEGALALQPASASPIPRRTARVGEFEAPGRELGTYESIPEGRGAWHDVSDKVMVPTIGDANVDVVGRASTPPEILTKVANRQYIGGFVNSAKAILNQGGEGFRPAMQVLQSVADRVLGGARSSRPDPVLKNIAAGVQGMYGWNVRDYGIATSPAEFFHYGVSNVAVEEQQRAKDGLPPYTPAEQRQRIIELMAEKQVLILLHEAAHEFGPEGITVEEQHGGDFKKLFDPIDVILENVNNGTLSAAQMARIERRFGLEDGQVRALAAELDAMVKATISTLTETFATVEGQADNLALLNQDAKEQRLLALTQPRTQRANPTQRNNQRPDDGDVGGGSVVPPAPGPTESGVLAPGESGTGVPGGEGDASRSAEPEGADVLRSPESAPVEPGPVEQPTESGAPATGETAARPAQLTDPRLPEKWVAQLRTYVSTNARSTNTRPHVANVIRVLQKQAGDQLAGWSPRAIRWQMGFAQDSAEDQMVQAILQRLYPDQDVSSRAPVEYFASQITDNINDVYDVDEPRTWNEGEIQQHLGFNDPAVATRVLAALARDGIVVGQDRDGELTDDPKKIIGYREVDPATRQSVPVSTPPPTQVRERTPREIPTRQAPPRQQTISRTPTLDRVNEAVRQISDDTWLDNPENVNMRGGGRSIARTYGRQLAEQIIVDGNKHLTESNRQTVIDALTAKRAEIDEQRKAADAADNGPEIARLKNRRAIITAISAGFGYTRGYEIQPGVTATFPGQDGKPEERVITRWVTARSGVPMMAVRGIGYVAANAKTDEAREALTILGRYVARVLRTSFQDAAGNPISMSESVRLGFEILYGKSDVSNAQAMQDVEQLSKTLLGQMPDMDVTLPEMMGLLLQAHQLMVTEALAELKAAADFEKQNKVKQDDVFGDGDVLLGKGGTRKSDALKAMQELYKVSTLLPSIKKLATTGGRILRIMQMAEERMAMTANLVNYQDMDRSITGITNLLEQVQADLKKGGPAAVEQFAQRLRLIDSGSNDPSAVLGRAPVDQLIRAILEQDKGGMLFILNQLAGNVNTYAELEKAFLGSDNPYASGLPLKQQLAQLREGLALEASGVDLPIDHNEKAQELAKKFTAAMITGAAKRRTEGREVGESGKSAEAEAKAKWRGTDRENYGLELINRKIDRLNANEIERALKEIEAGLMPDMDTFWSEHVRAPQTFIDENGVEQTESVPTRRDQRQRLWEKRNELLTWKRENDDKSLAYRRDHSKDDHPIRAGAKTDDDQKSLQEKLGEAFRQEILLDAQIAHLKTWIADVKATGETTVVTDVEAYLAEAEADLASNRDAIEQTQLDMQIALLPELTEAIERSVTKRDELEATMDDKKLESALVMHLGLAAQQKIDRDMLLEAFSRHDIGKVEKLVRDAMGEHYHQTYDERLDAEYWVNFVEQMEKEYGENSNVSVQLKLQDMRDRAYQQLKDLSEHPIHGDQMAQGLRSRLVRAVHGDAGSLVLGIQSALTAPGYRVDGERHPDYDDVQTLSDKGIIESLAGDHMHPGPLAVALDDRNNPQAFTDLNDALTEIEKKAGYGLGAAFKQAVLAAVDVAHARANILDLLPMVEANPTDSLLRYMVEVQLLGLKEKLGDHATETWFRRRFGSVELSLRRQYERAIEKGSDRLEKAAEQAAESVNTYNTLVAYGLETEADARVATEGKAFKKSAMELVLERMEKQRADALRKQIVAVTTEYWAEPNAGSRQMLEDHQQTLLTELRTVGAYTNEQGETVGVGPQLAAKLDDQILKRYFSEESRQGIRQQGWDQRAEIKVLEQQIREIHGHLMQGHEDGVTEALQQGLQDRIADLDAVGSTETEDALKNMGHTAAERIVKELGLKEVRLEERDTVRKGRRAATEELRDLRQDAMTAVRAMAKDPQNPLLRQDLLDALDAMDQVGYTDYEDVQVTDTDPTNGGTIGHRTEHREVRREVGKTQADAIRKLVLIRIGSTMDQLDTMADRTDLDRPTEQSITQAIQDRVKALMGAARESDTGNRVGAEIQGLIDVLTRLGVAGQQAAKAEQAKLHSTGVARSMLRTDEDARAQTTTFFNMIADSTDPQNVARAMRLMTNPSWSTYYRELGVIFMLSSPTTWGWFGTSAIGQTANVILRLPLWATRATVSQFMGERKAVYWSEAGAAARALGDLSLWKDSLKSAREIYAHGHSGAQMNKASGSGDLRDLNSEAFVEATIDKGGAWRALHELAVWGHRVSLRPLKMLDEITKNVVYAAAFEAQLERKVQQLNQIEKRTPGNEITRFDVLNDNKYIRDYGDVLKKAGHIQQTAVFQEKDPLLGPANGLLHWAGNKKKDRNVGHDLIDVALATYVPFSTVPYNSLKQAAQMSILGTVGYGGMTAVQLMRGRGNVESAQRRVAEEKKMPLEQLRLEDVDNLLGKRKAMAENEQISDFVSKAAFGAMIQVLGWALAVAGNLTGDEPEDPDDRAVNQEEKLPPRSIKLGGKWYSYDNTPFAVAFAISANIEQNWKKEWAKLQKGSPDEKVGASGAVGLAAGKGALGAVTHNFFLENLVQAASQAMGQDKTATSDRVAYTLAAPWVTRHTPALLSYFASQGDKVMRDTRGEDIWARLGNVAENRTPGLRQQLPEKVGILGQPVENVQPFGAGLVQYSKSQQAQFDQIFRMLGQYEIKQLSAPKEISVPTLDDSSFPITLDEQRAWQKTFGDKLREKVVKTYTDSNFTRQQPSQRDPTESLYQYQKRSMQEAVDQAKEIATYTLLQSYGNNDRERNLILLPRIEQARQQRYVIPARAPS